MIGADKTDVVFVDDRLCFGDVCDRSVDGRIAAMLVHVAAMTVRTACSTVSAADRLQSTHRHRQSADEVSDSTSFDLNE